MTTWFPAVTLPPPADPGRTGGFWLSVGIVLVIAIGLWLRRRWRG